MIHTWASQREGTSAAPEQYNPGRHSCSPGWWYGKQEREEAMPAPLSASLGQPDIPQGHCLWQALTLHEAEPQHTRHQGGLALQTGEAPLPSAPMPNALSW